MNEISKLALQYQQHNTEENFNKLFIVTKQVLIKRLIRMTHNNQLDIVDDILQDIGFNLPILCKNYNPKYSFTTYLIQYINTRIIRNINQYMKPFSVPSYISVYNYKLLKYREEYNKKYNKYPTDEEIINKLKITKRILKYIYLSKKYTISLNQLIDDNNHEIIDKITYNIDKDDILNLECKEILFELIKKLNPKEQELLKLKFDGLTYVEIGKHFNLNKQRIEQIYNRKIIPKLRQLYMQQRKEFI